MPNKIVLDLETQKDFSEVGGRKGYSKLRVSLCGIYSYADDQYQCFYEKDLTKLGELLQITDQVIGYNIKQFDFEVLQPYVNFPLSNIPTLDILEESEKVLGHRMGLGAIAKGTLGAGKNGSGAAAIQLWRTGKLDVLREYCLNDVKLTREIYEYALANGKLIYQDFFEKREILLKISEPSPRLNAVQQVSLF